MWAKLIELGEHQGDRRREKSLPINRCTHSQALLLLAGRVSHSQVGRTHTLTHTAVRQKNNNKRRGPRSPAVRGRRALGDPDQPQRAQRAGVRPRGGCGFGGSRGPAGRRRRRSTHPETKGRCEVSRGHSRIGEPWRRVGLFSLQHFSVEKERERDRERDREMETDALRTH